MASSGAVWKQEEFIPHDYLKTYYDGSLLTRTFVTFTLEKMNNTFKGGELTGTMIDVGCGPTIHCLISASAYCDSIICSDYTPANREHVEKWLKEDHVDYDWLPFFEYVEKLERKRTVLKMQDDVRQKVKDVIHCDVRKSEVIPISDKNTFDIVLTSLCLEEATNNKDDYFKCLHNVTALLKSKGTLLLVAVINQPGYPVGSIWHETAPVLCEEITTFLKSDFDIVDYEFLNIGGDGWDGFLFVRAKLQK